ncbi:MULTISPECIES: HDOD domain-containing protein [unclassified Undibacterium]|uniref:HDOD domain-containing protein n=1 Tax=unclassified Undibacterium TaxID=2630295 RepID=UPI002AC97AA4|nr:MULTISPECIES: HDOD domain-containing protein [unclassified Undibacterium]MEB0137802.1 HDOD domain-containing protein [Undibacterium sp. CCC2.1]MEB0171007.1 HDOD domain-containing protein [Undibacterium sp. CCC1.1]MEB0175052.1 HDOD domain-containing protein [Undibacterium sp. CCC3.4]MEB0215170.1 HDOD domain-containing protein [Undibacterium sp. 5I2]WPX44857.1 HDOD domain-containing protein [Undibacterium sp. CCC3.4]
MMNKSQALEKIVAQVSVGELYFPTNVSATLGIQEALNAPDCGIETAAKWIMKEPLIAARVVAIANSVAYSRFGGGVTNVRTAISILGFSTLRSVTAAHVIRQISMAVNNAELRARMELLWQHCAHVAAMAHLLARKISRVDPETALFAGVVHEVGGFYLLARAEEFPALLEPQRCAPDDALLEDHEIVVGRAVLHKLLVPKRVVSAIETLWYGTLTTPPDNLGDTLLLANELCGYPSPLDPRDPVASAAQAARIDFAVGDTSLRALLVLAEPDLASLTACLSN